MLDVDVVAAVGTGSPRGTHTIDVCMCGGSTRARRCRAKWNGLRPSGRGAPRGRCRRPTITRVPSPGSATAAVSDGSPPRTGRSLDDVGPQREERLVAVPQGGAEPDREAPAGVAPAAVGQACGVDVADGRRAAAGSAGQPRLHLRARLGGQREVEDEAAHGPARRRLDGGEQLGEAVGVDAVAPHRRRQLHRHRRAGRQNGGVCRRTSRASGGIAPRPTRRSRAGREHERLNDGRRQAGELVDGPDRQPVRPRARASAARRREPKP